MLVAPSPSHSLARSPLAPFIIRSYTLAVRTDRQTHRERDKYNTLRYTTTQSLPLPLAPFPFLYSTLLPPSLFPTTTTAASAAAPSQPASTSVLGPHPPLVPFSPWAPLGIIVSSSNNNINNYGSSKITRRRRRLRSAASPSAAPLLSSLSSTLFRSSATFPPSLITSGRVGSGRSCSCASFCRHR